MFNTKSVITILLIALGASLFYLWYSTWHTNISSHSINKHLIEENLKSTPPQQNLPKPSIVQTTPTQTQTNPPNTQQNTNQPTKNETTNQPSSSLPSSTTVANKEKSKSPKKVFTKSQKPVIRKQYPKITRYTKPKYTPKPKVTPVIRKPKNYTIKNQKTNNNLQIRLNQESDGKSSLKMLNKGSYYQAGAFKYFSDALSLSIELKAKGYKTKIIHQDGLYKVIAY